MRRFILSLLLMAVAIFFFADAALAEEASKSSAFADDVKRARDIVLKGAGDNPLGRGFMVALFDPVFLAGMFCLGLWSGQMSERITSIWALPLITFGATLIGAFITAYHGEWKPDFKNEEFKFLSDLGNTSAITVVVGLLAGTAVGLNLIVAPFLAIGAAALAGLALGFSQMADLGEHKNSLVPFWTGYGLMGLLINIFGIGFETFLQSIKLVFVTRWAGFATLASSFMLVSKVF